MTLRFVVHEGDCLEVLRTLPDCSVDSVVTDPPYGLSDHKPGEVMACLMAWIEGKPYEPKGKGFMGKKWDAWVPGPDVWRECLRVLKPGGHLLAFAGTRSMDLMSMAVRLAGFELRDAIGYAHDGTAAPLLAWTYGSGFPKSMDVSKAIDKAAGATREVVGRAVYGDGHVQNSAESIGYGGSDPDADQRLVTAPATDAAKEWEGWGTALKPAWEPIILARKPLEGTVAANVLAHGTGALNIDACRVAAEGEVNPSIARRQGAVNHLSERSAAEAQADGKMESRQSPEAYRAERAGEALGRWPANLIHDGSDEVLAAFPQAKGQQGTLTGREPSAKTENTFGEFAGRAPSEPRGDAGSAARFFYVAKASRADRNSGCDGFTERAVGSLNMRSDSHAAANGNLPKPRANVHPTVKPTDLMRYLCRLVTPPGGVVLDPFTGSGSTGRGAVLEGFEFIGIELDPDYAAIARARIGHAEIHRAAAEGPEPETAEDKQMALI